MSPVGLANTRISTDYVQKFPQSLSCITCNIAHCNTGHPDLQVLVFHLPHSTPFVFLQETKIPKNKSTRYLSICSPTTKIFTIMQMILSLVTNGCPYLLSYTSHCVVVFSPQFTIGSQLSTSHITSKNSPPPFTYHLISRYAPQGHTPSYRHKTTHSPYYPTTPTRSLTYG